MSIFPRSRWQEWAREWGLAHVPQKGWLMPTERVTGERKGLLVRAGWGTRENPGLIVCVRFPRVVDVGRLRQTLKQRNGQERDDMITAVPPIFEATTNLNSRHSGTSNQRVDERGGAGTAAALAPAISNSSSGAKKYRIACCSRTSAETRLASMCHTW